jgi:hypothetical protein
MRLLLPGRHHLLTSDQLEFLTLVTGGQPVALSGPIDTLIWAITSANHAHTRRNPLPGHRREVAIEEFAAQLDVPSFVYHVDDVGSSARFADYILKKVEVDSQGRFHLTPDNSVVATGTPELAGQFEQLGFRVLVPDGDQPWQLLEELVQATLSGANIRTHPSFLRKASRASRRLVVKYGYDELITDLYRDPVGTADGDLTATRDYNVYVRAFDEGAERKCALVREHVLPGRIVDVGCCTGALLQQLTRDDRLRESDFYGIELARPLYEECLHRKRQGAFGSDHVFFYQCNIAEKAVFAPGSVDTFTTFSLTHEIESYQGRPSLLRFIELLYRQLAVGGRWLNVDVVGPEDGDQPVLLWLQQSDGRSDDYRAVFQPDERARFRSYLAALSTLGRFLRFAQDFRREEGFRLAYEMETIEGEKYARLRLRDACEFLSKKDYLDNWRSEMHETFCFWSLGDWRRAVEQAGFVVQAGSHTFVNPWVVQNRYEGKARLYRPTAGAALEAMAWPATTLVLVAEKR